MQKIRLLMKGNTELTNQLAVQLYYQIQMEDIQFVSMAGLDFLDRIMDALSEEQLHRLRARIKIEKKRPANMQIM